jgi:anti-sigma factor RsiW
MMTCRELATLLIDYVSGELSEDHRKRLDAHLSLCPPCVTYVETYHLTIKLTRQLPDAPLPPQLVNKLKMLLCEMRSQGGAAGEAGASTVDP